MIENLPHDFYSLLIVLGICLLNLFQSFLGRGKVQKIEEAAKAAGEVAKAHAEATNGSLTEIKQTVRRELGYHETRHMTGEIVKHEGALVAAVRVQGDRLEALELNCPSCGLRGRADG